MLKTIQNLNEAKKGDNVTINFISMRIHYGKSNILGMKLSIAHMEALDRGVNVNIIKME